MSQGLLLNSNVNPQEAHMGEDYGNNTKPAGFEIFAVADGWVACTYSSNEKGDLGNAVFVESLLPDGSHITTLYGHLAGDGLISKGTAVHQGVTSIGKLGTPQENGNWPVHLHIGIRDGFFVEREQGWPNRGWGYTCKEPGCPPKPEEFQRWHALSDFVDRFPPQQWRTESQTLTFIVPWWHTFSVCDHRRIKVYFDGNLIFYTSSEDGFQASQSANILVWPGLHRLMVELFDYPGTKTVGVIWPLVPVGNACADEPAVLTPTTSPTNTASPTRQSPTPSLSSDKDALIYEAEGNLWIIDPDGSNKKALNVNDMGLGFRNILPPPKQVDPIPGTSIVSLSPDGRVVAFDCWIKQESKNEICTIGVDGTNLRRITNAKGIDSSDPSWSPDGRRIVFSAHDRYYQNQMRRVAMVDSDGKNFFVTGINGEQPIWSPLGNQIAFYIRSSPKDLDGLYLSNLDGNNRRLLIEINPRYPTEIPASWVADGSAIALSNCDDNHICVVTTGGSVRRIQISKSVDHVAWSPNGTMLAVTTVVNPFAKEPSYLSIIQLDGRIIRSFPFSGYTLSWGRLPVAR